MATKSLNTSSILTKSLNTSSIFTGKLRLSSRWSHLIPIRLPLSLSAIQKPKHSNHLTIVSISDMRWVRQRWWLWVEDDDAGWWPDWSKLDKGLYSNQEELEADEYLICSNEMQYNSSDTVFFRQVGVHAEHGYLRSLAQFAANMGPIVWEIASKKIRKALPPGVTFNPGVVGEPEPPAPSISFLTSENYSYTPRLASNDILNKPETPSTSGPKAEDSEVKSNKTVPHSGKNGFNEPKESSFETWYN
ncbi:putative chromatin remodeler Bromodomain family [Helianthus debilis subsp. tardiflorus]